MAFLKSSPALAGEGDREHSANGGGVLRAVVTSSPDPFTTRLKEPSGPPPPVSGGGFIEAATRLAGFAGAVRGWPPDTFWCSTPAELAAVVAVLRGADDAVEPPDAATFQKLQEAFPDG